MTENKGHILIVEDEASLREITAERLSENGYGSRRLTPEKLRVAY